MRELRVISVEADGSHVVVQDDETKEKFRIRADDSLRAAARGDVSRLGQIQIEMESALRPREIQAKIRSGATVDEVAQLAGVPAEKVERFAHPVLLERARAAELAAQAHPIREDGPAVETLGTIVDKALAVRGFSPASADWDAWKGDDGFWVVQVRWTVGRSDSYAHWRFHPGAHGGTTDPLDDLADELTDPEAGVMRRRLAPVDATATTVTVDAASLVTPHDFSVVPEPDSDPDPEPAPESDPKPRRRKQRKPAVPAWEDVLLGVRSTPNS